MNTVLEELLGENYYTFVAEEKSKYGTDNTDNQFLMRPVLWTLRSNYYLGIQNVPKG